MKITTSDGKTFEGISSVCRSIRAIQETKVMKKVSGALEGDTAMYNGHKVNSQDSVSLSQPVTKLLQDLKLCHREGKIYSGDSNVFTEKHAKYLACFLKNFIDLLSKNLLCETKQIMMTASEMKDGLKWLIPVMQAVGCYTRAKEIQVENIIKKLENQGVY